MYGEKDQTIFNLLIVGFVLCIILIIFLFNIYVYHRRYVKQYQDNTRAEMNGREEERKRIAKDLHDDLGATLSAVKMYLQGITVLPEKETKFLEKATNSITESINSIRYIMNDLYPISLEKYGIETCLEEIIEQINATEQLRIILLMEVNNLESLLSKESKIHIFRIIKEIINNTIKHSKSKVLSIKFALKDRRIIIETIDNGIGYNTKNISHYNHGHGIRNITSRVELMKGNIYIETELNQGIHYTIEIPINHEQA